MPNFKNKKIAILGYGREGKSLRHFLSGEGIEATILDRDENLVIDTSVIRSLTSTISQAGESARREGEARSVSTLGVQYLGNLDNFDLVFRSPGVPRLTPELLAAEKKGVEISSATKLFFDLCPCPIVGVTGTKGKGTTASLIYEILKKQFQISNDKLQKKIKSQILNKKVYLGGNIGNPVIDFLPKLKPEALVILELSSFQLQDLRKSPHIAVVLDIFVDHLDHHKTKEEYQTAKESIVKYQNEEDLAVLYKNSDSVKKISKNIKAKTIWFTKYEGKIKLLGEHNLINAEAARVTASLLGVRDSVSKAVIEKFKGLPHRLEFVKNVNGVTYYNDSQSTISETAIAAIDSFQKPKILILGGSEKGLEYAGLARKIVNSDVKAVILVGEAGKRIEKELKNQKYKGSIKSNLKTMKEMVENAAEAAESGDVVLLSPAAASFGTFKSYEDRGDQFKAVVKGL